nr:MAG TPA: hypothetical protein [Caudoviricetes sp.]
MFSFCRIFIADNRYYETSFFTHKIISFGVFILIISLEEIFRKEEING